MKLTVYIRRKIGWCPICQAPILDAGWTDDPSGWVHSMPIPPVRSNLNHLHLVTYGVCAMALSRFG